MEYQTSFFPIFLALLLFVLMIWKISKSRNCSALNLLPGPMKLPLIGNMHLLVGDMAHRRMRDLATKYGPVMHLLLGELSVVIISSPEAAKEMMKEKDTCFLQRPEHPLASIVSYNGKDVVFSPYGDYWRQVRKISTMELLSTKRVLSYRSVREEVVSSFIRSIASAPGVPINFSKKAFSLLNDITAKTAFGGRCKVQKEFIHAVERVMVLTGGLSVADMFPSMKFLEVFTGISSELERLHKKLDELAESVINDHRAAGKKKDEEDDLVQVLLNHEEQGLTTENIKAIILDMFIGGSETTSVLMEWTMSELLKHPRVLEKVQAEVRKVCHNKGNVVEADLHELQYLKLVIKETLRLHPPATLMPARECIEACKIMGYDIPVGSKVIVNLWAIGRDPKYWTEADRFYPERFVDSSIDYKGNHFELLPFGAGRRMCPGVSFSTANVELPIAQLLYHFDWKLPKGIKNEDLDMSELFGFTVGRKNDLYLIPIPHQAKK